MRADPAFEFVGWVRPSGRNPTCVEYDAIGLRPFVVSLSNHEAANPTYKKLTL